MDQNSRYPIHYKPLALLVLTALFMVNLAAPLLLLLEDHNSVTEWQDKSDSESEKEEKKGEEELDDKVQSQNPLKIALLSNLIGHQSFYRAHESVHHPEIFSPPPQYSIV